MVTFCANMKLPSIRHYWHIINNIITLRKHTEMVSYHVYTSKNTDYARTYGLKSCNLRQNFSSESSLGQLTFASQRSLPSMQAPSPQVNCHCEHFPAILTVEWVTYAERGTNVLVTTVSHTAAVNNILIRLEFHSHHMPVVQMVKSVINKAKLLKHYHCHA